MNALVTTLGGMFRNTTGRLVLGAALAGIGSASTAQAHDDLQIDLDLHHGHVELEQRHFVPGVVEDRAARIWVEPVYQTVPGPRVWVEPVYKTVVDHVWREPVVQETTVQVLVPDAFEVRDIVRGHHVYHERVLIPAHTEARVQQAVITPGHFDDITRQELACDGHWQVTDQQVLVTPGHFELRIDRVHVTDGHWVERPIVRVH